MLGLWHVLIYLFIFQPEAPLYLHQDRIARTPERDRRFPHLPPSLPPLSFRAEATVHSDNNQHTDSSNAAVFPLNQQRNNTFVNKW